MSTPSDVPGGCNVAPVLFTLRTRIDLTLDVDVTCHMEADSRSWYCGRPRSCRQPSYDRGNILGPVRTLTFTKLSDAGDVFASGFRRVWILWLAEKKCFPPSPSDRY